MTSAPVVSLIGLPGVGKSTALRRLLARAAGSDRYLTRRPLDDMVKTRTLFEDRNLRREVLDDPTHRPAFDVALTLAASARCTPFRLLSALKTMERACLERFAANLLPDTRPVVCDENLVKCGFSLLPLSADLATDTRRWFTAVPAEDPVIVCIAPPEVILQRYLGRPAEVNALSDMAEDELAGMIPRLCDAAVAGARILVSRGCPLRIISLDTDPDTASDRLAAALADLVAR